jgi:N-acetylneuraminate synthase
MMQLFDCPVGLSDHTMGIGAAVAAVALGASVIEKHFTLSRAEGGVDSAFSLEPHELKALVVETERAFLSLGRIQYGVQKAEEKSLKFKRSLYVVEDIQPGEPLTVVNVKSKRPALGLHTKYYEEILGKKAKEFIRKGTPLSSEMIG